MLRLISFILLICFLSSCSLSKPKEYDVTGIDRYKQYSDLFDVTYSRYQKNKNQEYKEKCGVYLDSMIRIYDNLDSIDSKKAIAYGIVSCPPVRPIIPTRSYTEAPYLNLDTLKNFIDYNIRNSYTTTYTLPDGRTATISIVLNSQAEADEQNHVR